MIIFKEKISTNLAVNFHVTVKNDYIIKTTLKVATDAAFFCTIEIDQRNSSIIDKILIWLKDYANKKSSINLPLLVNGSDFKKKVYQSLLKIGLGKTASYQDIAAEIGSKSAARAIGNACNKNPFPLFIPCHRVIRKNQQIGGFALPIEIKESLLAFETNPPPDLSI